MVCLNSFPVLCGDCDKCIPVKRHMIGSFAAIENLSAALHQEICESCHHQGSDYGETVVRFTGPEPHIKLVADSDDPCQTECHFYKRIQKPFTCHVSISSIQGLSRVGNYGLARQSGRCGS